MILLFIVTLGVGVLALVHSGHDNGSLFRFTALFANPAFYNIKSPVRLMLDPASLWYGGIALVAIITAALVLRAVRRDSSQGFTTELTHAKRARAEAAKLSLSDTTEVERVLRNELKAMSEFVRAKDSAITELERSLTAKQQLVQRRSEELDTLRSKVNSLTEQLADVQLAKERAENVLQQEIKKIRVLQSKDSIIQELENSLTVTQEHLRSRSEELEQLKSKVNSLTAQVDDLRLAKDRTQNILEREVEKTKALQADLMMQEKKLNQKVLALENKLREKQEILQTRNRELKGFRAEVNTLREQLTALGSAKEQTETVLQQQLRSKTELLQSKELALQDLEESMNTRVHVLETELKEKERLLQQRGERETLGSEAKSLTGSDSTREAAKSLLLQELQSRNELIQAKDIIVRELEERLNMTARALIDARNEVERLVKQHDGKLSAVGDPPIKIETPNAKAEGWTRRDRKGMNFQLLELGAAKARAAAVEAKETQRATEV